MLNSLVTNLKCNVPVSELRTMPFNLPWGAIVYAKVKATNIYGDSEISLPGSGAKLMTIPNPPKNLRENIDARSSTTLGILWDDDDFNGGDAVFSYRFSLAVGSDAY
jgi:hypothetical protein